MPVHARALLRASELEARFRPVKAAGKWSDLIALDREHQDYFGGARGEERAENGDAERGGTAPEPIGGWRR